MHVITGPRQSGKTTAVVEYMRKHPEAVLLIPPQGGVSHVKYRALEIGSERVISWSKHSELASRLAGRNVTVIIDDLDRILSNLIGRPVERAWATGTSVPISREPSLGHLVDINRLEERVTKLEKDLKITEKTVYEPYTREEFEQLINNPVDPITDVLFVQRLIATIQHLLKGHRL